jgi:acyl phosphate:glycerol-3-phosphate acyltransferase
MSAPPGSHGDLLANATRRNVRGHDFGGHVGDILFSSAGFTAIAIGYLLGSIPFGLLLTKAAGLGDVRKIGSGNIGATNVLRTGNKGLAALTLLLDALKATAAVYIVYRWLAPAGAVTPANVVRADMLSALAGVAAFVGHTFPVWLSFKGGKGVATFIGATLGFYWPVALGFCLLWLGLAAMFRISSLAALVASLLVTIYTFVVGDRYEGVLMLIMTVLIFYKHAANIQRLFEGTEPRIGQKS